MADSVNHRSIIDAILAHWNQWMDRDPETLTYRVTQVLTGHGCFGNYLCQIGAETLSKCAEYGAERDSLVLELGILSQNLPHLIPNGES